jgi:hypothetical protein
LKLNSNLSVSFRPLYLVSANCESAGPFSTANRPPLRAYLGVYDQQHLVKSERNGQKGQKIFGFVTFDWSKKIHAT